MSGPDHPTTVTRATDPLVQRPAPQGVRYRLIRELGRGGAAVVYLAEDAALGQQVAYKRILGEPDAQRLERIRREAQAGRRLSHPALVRIHDLIETPEGPAIIMEAVDGPTLRQVLRERGSLPLHEAMAIHREVLAALEALHGANLLHRDIKPENIFLPWEGGVKVGDYSICLPMERTRLTSNGSVVGTMGYMAPEQVEGREVRPCSDLYAAAVVLYEMITGRRPFQGDTPTQMLYAQLHRPPDLDAVKEAGAPRWLRGYLRRCLSRRPTERYASVRVALSALEERRSRVAPLALARRFGTAALAALAAAGAVGGVRAWGHRAVAALEIAGAEVIARDRLGQIHWRHALPLPPAASLLEDLNGDGLPEAFLVAGRPRGSAHLLLIGSEGNLEGQSSLSLADEDQGLGGGYGARLYSADLDGDGVREVFGHLSSAWHPTHGFVYHLHQRKITLTFHHPGHIAETIFADLDGNGTRDIILRAMNNALGHEGVLVAFDGATACGGTAEYAAQAILPGWRSPEAHCSGVTLFYTFLPHDGYVYAGRTGTFARTDAGWRITPMATTIEGDAWGNLRGGPTDGMKALGRYEARDYFLRLKGMMAAGLAGDRSRTVPEAWLLPGRFKGRPPWDRVFRLVRGRELIRCGAVMEGLGTLEALAGELPLDQEVNEVYGVQLFLATGNAERGAALALKNSVRVLYRPASGRVAAAKIDSLAGRLSADDLEKLEDDFTSNSGQLERARILLAMGLWAKARQTALAIPELSPASYRIGGNCCLAVVEAATTGLTARTLERARAEADEYPDLVPISTLAEAVEAALRGGPEGKARAEALLAPIRRNAAWDLDARLCIAAFDRATRQLM